MYLAYGLPGGCGAGSLSSACSLPGARATHFIGLGVYVSLGGGFSGSLCSGLRYSTDLWLRSAMALWLHVLSLVCFVSG